MTMTSSRPYVARALYEWIVDNDCTPYVLVNAQYAGVVVPQEHVRDGQIVLNIAPSAIRGLLMGNDAIEFNGRFGGVSRDLYVPIPALMAIYARENGQGMVFEIEADELDDDELLAREEHSELTDSDPTPPRPSGRPSLKVVK